VIRIENTTGDPADTVVTWNGRRVEGVLAVRWEQNEAFRRPMVTLELDAQVDIAGELMGAYLHGSWRPTP
jgi:hypothetical protein